MEKRDEYDTELEATLRLQEPQTSALPLVDEKAHARKMLEQYMLARSMPVEVRCGSAVYRGIVYLVEE